MAATYMIWAVDNVVYGPVEMPTLIQWIQEERVTADTWIYAPDQDAWLKGGRIEELQEFFGAATAPAPNPTAAMAASGLAANWLRPGMLRRMKIFAAMSDPQLERFAQFLEVQSELQWAVIVRQDAPGDAMYLVLDGEVRVRVMVDDKETILTTLAAGDFFGEFCLFDHGPRSADVIANKDTVLLRISAGAFHRVVSQAPELATPFLLAVGKTLAARIRADNKRLANSLRLSRAAH